VRGIQLSIAPNKFDSVHVKALIKLANADFISRDLEKFRLSANQENIY